MTARYWGTGPSVPASPDEPYDVDAATEAILERDHYDPIGA